MASSFGPQMGTQWQWWGLDNHTMAQTRKAIDETKISVDGVGCTEIVCLFREPHHSRPEGWTADKFLNAFCKCKGEMEMERRKPEELKCQGNSSWHNFVVEMIVQNIGKLCYRLQNSWKYWRTEELFCRYRFSTSYRINQILEESLHCTMVPLLTRMLL